MELLSSLLQYMQQWGNRSNKAVKVVLARQSQFIQYQYDGHCKREVLSFFYLSYYDKSLARRVNLSGGSKEHVW